MTSLTERVAAVAYLTGWWAAAVVVLLVTCAVAWWWLDERPRVASRRSRFEDRDIDRAARRAGLNINADLSARGKAVR